MYIQVFTCLQKLQLCTSHMAVLKTLHNAAEGHNTLVFDWKDTQEENAIKPNVRIIVACVILQHCFFHCLL